MLFLRPHLAYFPDRVNLGHQIGNPPCAPIWAHSTARADRPREDEGLAPSLAYNLKAALVDCSLQFPKGESAWDPFCVLFFLPHPREPARVSEHPYWAFSVSSFPGSKPLI